MQVEASSYKLCTVVEKEKEKRKHELIRHIRTIRNKIFLDFKMVQLNEHWQKNQLEWFTYQPINNSPNSWMMKQVNSHEKVQEDWAVGTSVLRWSYKEWTNKQTKK